MSMPPGTRVRHPDLGRGLVRESLGSLVVVDFYGESVQIKSEDLESLDEAAAPAAVGTPHDIDRILFRRAVEAITLGVVPPHPDQLLALSIHGTVTPEQLRRSLDSAKQKGLAKVFFGDYGTGKSHQLRTLEALGLKQGWVVSFVEFDPKEADPAKPHLVYRAIVAGLRFPLRDDGTRTIGFDGLVKEIRENWAKVSTGKYFRGSPWFWGTLSLLRQFSHSDDWEYRKALAFLGGQPIQLADVKRLATRAGPRVDVPPKMPRTLETSDIYAFHLVVINEVCRNLGYKGLLLVFDEAEHVRGYNTKRQSRANTFFDLLSRCAYPPISGEPPPAANDHGIEVPKYWGDGPHFGLAVGLTEGDTFSDPELAPREACAFLHTLDDAIFLTPPEPQHYKKWVMEFLFLVSKHYTHTSALLTPKNRELLSGTLAKEFGKLQPRERVTRLWVKLASLIPCIILAGNCHDIEDVRSLIAKAAAEVAGRLLPWEE